MHRFSISPVTLSLNHYCLFQSLPTGSFDNTDRLQCLCEGLVRKRLSALVLLAMTL